jgi:LacI family transcriptional regulator
MKKKITLQDIANELKITKGTVYRAIHDKPDVSPVTREKVLKLIEKYNYTPDKVARSLSLKSKKIRIGAIYQSESKFFWDNISNGIKTAEAELSDFGLEVIHKKLDDEREAGTILQAMNDCINEGVNAIVLVPANDIAVKEKINEICEMGIPVATLNDDIADSKRIFYVGPQVRQSGRIAGQLMGEFLNHKGKVFTINLDVASLEYKERFEGFSEIIGENYKTIDIIGNYNYNYKKAGDKGINILKGILDNMDEIDGIYCVDGGMLYDVACIIKGIDKLRNVSLIGHEIWSKVKELIADGTIKACISQDPFSQGYFVMKLLFEYLVEGKCPEFERMYTRLDIIMKENLIKQNNIVNPYYISTISTL